MCVRGEWQGTMRAYVSLSTTGRVLYTDLVHMPRHSSIGCGPTSVHPLTSRGEVAAPARGIRALLHFDG